jgi:hypothetical protein
VRQEGLGKLKNYNLIAFRILDLPDCSIVSQPTTLPRALLVFQMIILSNYSRFNSECVSRIFHGINMPFAGRLPVLKINDLLTYLVSNSED